MTSRGGVVFLLQRRKKEKVREGVEEEGKENKKN